ncbi:hypothetical protein PHAVU_006G073800 [Phaseolus vulgaris]|uniref:Uncharacterized protein n=1 Tax=Phaseolus vulgaris TaxID=3885 RepID=V7BP69_PHAVU|nr:hypothetical protein PHAVU_006G073800g [Phaseolus vulgaris]ESW18828.1 hypothetical protein PHAVU_006G073800g [Phaseolus vulgaris]
MEQNYVNLATEGNSTIPFPIACHSLYHSHTMGIFYGDNPLYHSFSLVIFNLAIINIITHFIGVLLKPLRQPFIVSQILGGIIVGPSLLGRSIWYRRHMTSDTAQFLMNNLGVMGFMFFLFIYGVKADPGILRKIGKLHISTALVGILMPMGSVCVVAISMRKNMDQDLAKVSSLGIVSAYLGITAFPVLYQILKEFNLLNSDLGRVALSIAMIGDMVGLALILLFEAASQGEVHIIYAVWYMICLVLMIAFLKFCVRPAMIWINNNTPEGQPVQESFVVAILLGTFFMGFLTDFFGIAIANGSLFLGLAIPDGPQVGATLEKKTSTILTDILLPFSFILVGSYTDIYAMTASGWSSLSPLISMVLIGHFFKFFCTWITLHLSRMSFRDGLTLSLIMSLRGQVELILFVHWIDKSVIKVPGFSMLVIMTMVLTAASSPLISILYDPTKPYMVNQRRNIQNHPPDSDLKIVLCTFDTDVTPGLIHLLDISNPTQNFPFTVSVLKLTELLGRANPLFIDHEKQHVPPSYQWYNTIHMLECHQQLKGAFMKLRFFTAVTPKKTMFRDICELAIEEEASLIMLPFNLENVYNHAVRTVNSQVLRNSPCSVAIFVDKGLNTNNALGSFRRTKHRFAVLFLGGGDSREALVYADRMLAHHDVSLTVIRFLSHNFIGYNEIEKKLDDGIVTWFWVKNEINQRVIYREVVSRNGEETIGAIQAMNDGAFDLLIVGRKQGINPILLTGLSEWTESEELGLIGDYVSSPDFFGSASVLVVQQQILRG